MRSRKRKKVKRLTPKRNGEDSSRRRYRSRVPRPGNLTRVLYHSPVARRSWLALVLLVAQALVAVAPVGAGGLPDRLERFRDLAGHRLSLLQLDASARSADEEREIYALLDEEV